MAVGGSKSWLAACLAVVVGLGVFAWRGPMRADEQSRWDAILLLSAARTWVEGRNPYSPAEVDLTWKEMGGDERFQPSFRGAQSFVYPPCGWAILAPWSFGGPEIAAYVWIGTNCVLFGACLLMVVHLAKLPWGWPGTWLFVGAGLCLGAAHSGIMLGQTAILTMFLVLLGLVLEEQRRPWAGGVMLGLAAALKPQLGGLFVLYPLLRGRMGVVGGAAIAGFVSLAIGVGRLYLANISWWGPWKENVRLLAGDRGNPLAIGAGAFQLINLQTPVTLLLGERGLSNAIVWAALAALVAVYALVERLRGGWREESERLGGAAELASLTLVSCVSLLCAYRHYYDAVFVVIPLALGFVEWRRGRHAPAMVTLALTALLLVPGPAILHNLAGRGWFGASVTESLAWRAGPMQLHTWALAALGVWMVAWRMGRGTKATPKAVVYSEA